MKILVACEESGVVRRAFRERGHDAWSCDLEPADDNSLFHYQGDVFDILNDKWDMMIAHPPCTFLTNAAQRWLYIGGKKVLDSHGRPNVDQVRWHNMCDGAEFFTALRKAPIDKIAIENPVMGLDAKARIGVQQDQCVQPWWFGDKAFKGTCLWLKNLPPLVATNRLTPPKPGTDEHKAWSKIHRASPGRDRAKLRSRTFQGIADAMAEQWS